MRTVDATGLACGNDAQKRSICGSFAADGPGSVTMSRMRARTFWFLTLPALFVAETAGHTLMAQVIDPEDSRHRLLSQLLEEWALPLLAVVVLLAAAMLGRRVLASFRAEGRQPLPCWRLAALPALGFLFQEYAEQLAHEGRIAWLIASEPPVLLGVVLQLALGALAIWLVRTLLRAAEQLGSTLARRGPRWGRRTQPLRVRPFHAPEPRLAVLASHQAGRAPPAVA